ncbi:RIP metalloprotease [Candidatus Margulisiibacteriota bacterium]
MFTFLSFLVVFGIVVLFHEAGHFLVAKLAGIKVYEFSIGFGPRLLMFKRKGTVYGINAFPLGGAVRLAGLDELAKEKAKPSETYQHKSWGIRAGVLIAGPLMNIVLAFLIFVLAFSVIGVPQKASNVIMSVFPDSVAERAGWQAGDKITYFQGEKVTDMSKIIQKIHISQGQQLSFLLVREGKTFPAKLKPHYYPDQNRDAEKESPGIPARSFDRSQVLFHYHPTRLHDIDPTTSTAIQDFDSSW